MLRIISIYYVLMLRIIIMYNALMLPIIIRYYVPMYHSYIYFFYLCCVLLLYIIYLCHVLLFHIMYYYDLVLLFALILEVCLTIRIHECKKVMYDFINLNYCVHMKIFYALLLCNIICRCNMYEY